jgi:hypothetical protein
MNKVSLQLVGAASLIVIIFVAACAMDRSFLPGAAPKSDWPRKRVMVMPARNLTELPSELLGDTVSHELTSALRKSGFYVVYREQRSNPTDSLKIGNPIDPELLKAAQDRGMNALVFETLNPIEVNLVRRGIWPLRRRAQRFTVSLSIDIVDANTTALILSDEFAKDVTFSGEEIRTETEQTPYAARKQKAVNECLPKILKETARSVSRALNRHGWIGRIVSLDGEGIVVNAGRDAGLRPGVVFEVFCAAECITSCTGQTYNLPGPKVGEIKIVTLKARRCLAQVIQGAGFETGQLVRVKD